LVIFHGVAEDCGGLQIFPALFVHTTLHSVPIFDYLRMPDHPPGISVSLQGEHKQFIGNGNSSAHHLGERYFFGLICNRTGRRIF
jgi:hypothetical protein